MNLSQKPIKPAPGEAFFRFPRRLADDIDPVTRKRCFSICINNQKTLIPVEEPVHLTKDQFDFLATIGGYLPANREYDPIRRT